jgi:hypothetical protein
MRMIIFYEISKTINTYNSVKLGYNDHNFNEFTAITNKYNSTFLVPNGTFTT